MVRKVAILAGLTVLWALPMAAQEVRITADLPEVRLNLGGHEVVIVRNQDPAAVLQGEAALVARACPPDCLQPMVAEPGVETLGALEVIGFVQAEVVGKTGYLLDVRLPEGYAAGHLPGAVNVPAVTLTAKNPALQDILVALGARQGAVGLEFDAMRVLVIYGDGPVFDEAAKTVQGLVSAGVPADKLRYFRGGMQEWRQFGLTIAGSADQG